MDEDRVESDGAEDDGVTSTGVKGDETEDDSVVGEAAASEEEWRFGVDEVGEDAEPRVDPIEPGSPKIENVAFFVLGAVAMVSALGLLLFG